MEIKTFRFRLEQRFSTIERRRVVWSFWSLILATVFCASALYAAMCCYMRGENMMADILKERLARGEITEAQYKEQRRLLEG